MLIFLNNFTYNQLFYLGLSLVLIVSAIMAFNAGRQSLSLTLLFFGTGVLGFFIANMDPFLLMWDEQYHALVAKNMLDDPLKPTLYAHPVLPYDYKNWTYSHVWLHKQPLFLWQMALSMKLFGISALAARIPSILLHAILPLMIYRIGKITCNASTGFYGALFFAVASYPLEMVAGRHATDHNDMAFLFYFTASFWAWFSYQDSKKNYWLVLIGLLAGAAVLVKWLVGLMVYSIWALWIGMEDKRNWLKPKAYFPMLISLAFALLIFLPWQIFILYQYPLEAHYEFEFNTLHFFHALEGHGGDNWFHFNAIKELYGAAEIVPYILLAGLLFLFKNARKMALGLALVLPVVITYGFFTLAATKMTSFCIIAFPFIMLGLGALADNVIYFFKTLIKFRSTEKIVRPVLLIAICFYLIDFNVMENFHTQWNPKGHCGRQEELDQMQLIKKLSDTLGNKQTVVFNSSVKDNGYIEVMFFTNYVAYDFIPDKTQIELARKQHYQTAIIVKDSIPEFIRNDKDMIQIKM